MSYYKKEIKKFYKKYGLETIFMLFYYGYKELSKTFNGKLYS